MNDLKALARELYGKALRDRGLNIDAKAIEGDNAFPPDEHGAAALDAIEAALSRPAGGEWVWWPREPTPEMLAAPSLGDSPSDDVTRRILLAVRDVLASGNPDETGPFQCETCGVGHSGPRAVANSAGWQFTWDGWLCPTHALAAAPTPHGGEDARDAERWRWLRDNSEIDSTFHDVVSLEFPIGDEIDGFETLDEAVDAAIAASREVES